MKKYLFPLFLLFAAFTGNAQNVGIGTTTPLVKLHLSQGASGNINPFGPFVVEGNNNTYINLLSPDASETSVLFGKASNAASGGIVYNNFNTLNGFQFRTNGNLTRMVLDNNGSVGIGTLTPQARLDVNGVTKTNSMIITNGGSQYDFLIKNDVSGQVSFRKGYAGLGLNYIIALQGAFPSQNPPFVNGTYAGEIKLFSGFNAPFGWAICNGQLLNIIGNETLFALIGTIYGGNGVTQFGLPDLRDAVPIGAGTSWQIGEKSN